MRNFPELRRMGMAEPRAVEGRKMVATQKEVPPFAQLQGFLENSYTMKIVIFDALGWPT